jgi:hypothetical protein
MPSVKKYVDLDIETIICYHVGPVTDHAMGQLKRVAIGRRASLIEPSEPKS